MIDFSSFQQIIQNLSRRLSTVEVRDPASGSRSTPYAAFTPASITQSVGLTYTIAYCRWRRQGPTVHVEVKVAFTSAGTASNALQFALPTTVPGVRNISWVSGLDSNGLFYDADVATWTGLCMAANSARVIYMFAVNTAFTNIFGIQPAVTVASGDQLSFGMTYETSD